MTQTSRPSTGPARTGPARLPLRARTRVRATPLDPLAAVTAASALAVALFLAYAITAWRPHEDEALELFAGRGSIGDLYDTIVHRGGAPLHFLVAWLVVHLGGGLTALRACSALFAVAAVPVVASLIARLAGRVPAVVATPLLCASWTLLFHGVYARMYSLFLLTSALSYLLLLRATDRGGRRAWLLWGLAILAAIATHTYGAIVLASQGLYVLLARPVPLRRATPPFAAVAVAAMPFFWIDVVLAGRYEIGVGGGGSKLEGPGAVFRYFFHAAGDFTARWWWVVWPVLAVSVYGAFRLARSRPRSAILVASVIGAPLAIFLAARVGSSASPETRHVIFALPFFFALLATGLVALLRRPAILAAAVIVLVGCELAWTDHRAPELFRAEPAVRAAAREGASAWLARTSRPDDVLLGYDPLFLGAWEAGGAVSQTVVPRADAVLALKVLREAPKPLGRGVFVLDASDTNNARRRLTAGALTPLPRGAFEVRAWGPFVVIRTTGPTRTVAGFLRRAQEAQLLGKALLMGDSDVNYDTVTRAAGAAGG